MDNQDFRFQIEISELTEKQQVSYYGSLLAVAFADHVITKSEYELIHNLVKVAEISSEKVRKEIYSIAISPQPLTKTLEGLIDLPLFSRLAIYHSLELVIAADNKVTEEETRYLKEAQTALSLENIFASSQRIGLGHLSTYSNSTYPANSRLVISENVMCSLPTENGVSETKKTEPEKREKDSSIDKFIFLLQEQKRAKRQRDLLNNLSAFKER